MSTTITIDPEEARLFAAMEADVAKFETMLQRHLDGTIDDDVFRVFRLANGIYGQRQGGTNQMVRVKIPYGGVTPDQLDLFGRIATEYSRGWGHLTTRQNVQFHYVELTRVPDLLRELAAVGLTTREACGDTVRNVMGCHLAGACPFEHLDISAWAEAAYRHFVRHPFAQRLPRKFKINFSGCDTDCGQAMFNDVGVIATTRVGDDGSSEAGFRVFVAGGLGANPHPALALEPFTPREELLPTIEAILRVFEQTGNRKNKLRARMKWVVDELGWEETQARILHQRRFLLAAAGWPGGIPEVVLARGDAPAGRSASVTPTPVGQGVAVAIRSSDRFARWCETNVVRGAANGTISAIAYARLGDITADQFNALAALQRDTGASVRISNRQNLVFRDLSEDQLRPLFDRLNAIGMAEPGAELTRDVVSCPGSDTCNLAVTQSRGLASAIGDALEAAGLAEVPGIRTNISGCMNSCGHHHVADIGFFGAERRAHGRAAPGYQMMIGGYVGQERIEFGRKVLRLPAKSVPEAVVRLTARFNEERNAGETFAGWLERAGGPEAIAASITDLAEFPTPEDHPEYYVDFAETGPYAAVIGESECAV